MLSRRRREGERGQLTAMALAFLGLVGLLTIAVLRYADGVQIQRLDTSTAAVNNGVAQGGAQYLQVDTNRSDAPGCNPNATSGQVTFTVNGKTSTVGYNVSGCNNGPSGCVLCLDPGGSLNSDLLAVDAIDNTHVWAVGANCTALFSTGNGTWTPVPVSGCSGYNLTSIFVLDETDAWIVGSNGTHGIILSCSASCDSAAASWVQATGSTLPALSSVAAGTQNGSAKNTTDYYVYAAGAGGTIVTCQAAGASNSTGDPCAGTGGSWSSFTPAGFSNVSLAGISTVLSGSTWGVWAAGANGSNGFVGICTATQHTTTCGAAAGWAASAKAPTASTYNSVTAVDTTHVFVTGAGGTVLLCTTSCTSAANATWTSDGSGIAAADTVNSMAFVANNTVFVTSNTGNVYACSNACNAAGATWSKAAVVGTSPLNGVSAGDASHAWAVGATGTILFYQTPNLWGPQTSGVNVALNAAGAKDGTHLWAVGANCTVLFGNGTTWITQTVPTGNCPTGSSLTGVDANGGNPVIVGSNGSAGVSFACTANCNAASPTWANKSLPANFNVALGAVSAQNTTNMWAVGAPGTGAGNPCTFLYSNSTSGAWASVTTGTTACPNSTVLKAVAANNGKPYIAGAGGVLSICTASCTSGTGTFKKASVSGSPTFTGLDAAGGPGGPAVATGVGGVIYTCTAACDGSNGFAMSAVTSSGTAANLRAVQQSGNSLMIAVGDGGVIDTCSANCNKASGAWSAQTQGSANLLGATIVDATHVWAFGAGGTILFYPTNGWGPQASPAILSVLGGKVSAQGDVSVNGGISVAAGTALTASQPGGAANIYDAGTTRCSGTCSPAVQRLTGTLTDPLSNTVPTLQKATNTNTNGQATAGGDVTLTGSSAALTPELYYHNVTVNAPGGAAHLAGGRYVIIGKLNIQAGTLVSDAPVTIYFTCSAYPTSACNGTGNATLQIAGSLSIQSNANSSAIVFDPNNTSTISIAGQSSSSVAVLATTGSIDAPGATLSIGDYSTVTVLGRLVADSLSTSANSQGLAVTSCYTYAATTGDSTTPAKQGQAVVQPACTGGAGIVNFDYPH